MTDLAVFGEDTLSGSDQREEIKSIFIRQCMEFGVMVAMFGRKGIDLGLID